MGGTGQPGGTFQACSVKFAAQFTESAERGRKRDCVGEIVVRAHGAGRFERRWHSQRDSPTATVCDECTFDVGSIHGPLLMWLTQSAQNVSVPVGEANLSGSEAVMAGWDGLPEAMSARGIHSREGLSEWVHAMGFPLPRWSANFSGRAQERLLNAAVSHDGRVAALESVYVQVTLQACELGSTEETFQAEETHHARPRRRATELSAQADMCWAVLDSVDLATVFQRRFSVLQSCPFQFGGKVPSCIQCGVAKKKGRSDRGGRSERDQSVEIDPVVAVLVTAPIHRSAESLCSRFDKFTAGQWGELFAEGQRSVDGNNHQRSTPDSVERRTPVSDGQRWLLGQVTLTTSCRADDLKRCQGHCHSR